jgi:1-deoxy-D-xylulose-5-phosphate reductoisomerase
LEKNTLNIARALSSEIQVKALAAKSNIAALEPQIREFHPEIVAVYEEEKALELKIFPV